MRNLPQPKENGSSQLMKWSSDVHNAGSSFSTNLVSGLRLRRSLMPSVCDKLAELIVRLSPVDRSELPVEERSQTDLSASGLASLDTPPVFWPGMYPSRLRLTKYRAPQALQRTGFSGGPFRQHGLHVLPQWLHGPPQPRRTFPFIAPRCSLKSTPQPTRSMTGLQWAAPTLNPPGSR